MFLKSERTVAVPKKNKYVWRIIGPGEPAVKVDVPFHITTCPFLFFAAAKSEPMRPLQKSFKLTHMFERVASTALSFNISKSAKAFFRFPTKSGWLPLETILRFLTCKEKSYSSLVKFSPFQRHQSLPFNKTFCTFPCYLHTLPLFSYFLPHFSSLAGP